MITAASISDRRNIHYWKCDRPAAFHGTGADVDVGNILEPLRHALELAFPGQSMGLKPTASQGNHRTFSAEIDGQPAFIRVEDGPERDDYLEVESRLLREVATRHVATPRVLAFDATRTNVPFAWQALEYIPHPDLNQHYKAGRLNLPDAAETIGAAVARWQDIRPPGFGPFSPSKVRSVGTLQGLHPRYETYFMLRLDEHLGFLESRSFLSAEESGSIRKCIGQHRDLLQLEQGCLVHKDLALWNILGEPDVIAAYIDWDDAISGDPMDDLSLLACFHDAQVLCRALRGYATLRPLPSDHLQRFWLHLLRNMIVKAVIRVGAGYFDRDDGFFLINSGASGQTLRDFTRRRLHIAMDGLIHRRELAFLDS
ncbi:MAG TPA: aminoglycoside phosphotransferase family protein [Roseimicrobium sp.]|nr:aminoglycoside phosphotransferase family protein [Roseimicrobium sp.]